MSFSDLDDILGFANPNNFAAPEDTCRSETYFKDQFHQLSSNTCKNKTKVKFGEPENDDTEHTSEILSKLTKIISSNPGRLNFWMGCFVFDKLETSSIRRMGVELGPFTINKILRNCPYAGLADKNFQVNLINLFEWIGINTA